MSSAKHRWPHQITPKTNIIAPMVRSVIYGGRSESKDPLGLYPQAPTSTFTVSPLSSWILAARHGDKPKSQLSTHKPDSDRQTFPRACLTHLIKDRPAKKVASKIFLCLASVVSGHARGSESSPKPTPAIRQSKEHFQMVL